MARENRRRGRRKGSNKTGQDLRQKSHVLVTMDSSDLKHWPNGGGVPTKKSASGTERSWCRNADESQKKTPRECKGTRARERPGLGKKDSVGEGGRKWER